MSTHNLHKIGNFMESFRGELLCRATNKKIHYNDELLEQVDYLRETETKLTGGNHGLKKVYHN